MAEYKSRVYLPGHKGKLQSDSLLLLCIKPCSCWMYRPRTLNGEVEKGSLIADNQHKQTWYCTVHLLPPFLLRTVGAVSLIWSLVYRVVRRGVDG